MNFFAYRFGRHLACDSDFDESKVRREAKGGEHGGQFAKKPETLAKEDQRDDLNKGESGASGSSAALDAEYIDAVKNGDMEKAAKMVRDAAARAMPNTKITDADGKPLVVYHGTDKRFTIFDKTRQGDRSSWYGDGFYFSDSETDAGFYGDTHNFFINMTNPFKAEEFEEEFNPKIQGTDIGIKDANKEISEISKKVMLSKEESGPWVTIFTSLDGGENWNYYTRQGKVIGQKDEDVKRTVAEREFARRHGIESFSRPTIKEDRFFSARLVERGNDGLVADSSNLPNAKEYVVYEPTQIKSSDTVTYDDDGNIIPLSKRFDLTNPDIRY